MPKERRSRAGGRRTHARPPGFLVGIPEDLLAGIASKEQLDLDAGSDDLDAGWTLRLDVAVAEISRALVDAGRPLAALHALRECADALGYRRGYRDGARTIAAIANGVATDVDGTRTPTGRRR